MSVPPVEGKVFTIRLYGGPMDGQEHRVDHTTMQYGEVRLFAPPTGPLEVSEVYRPREVHVYRRASGGITPSGAFPFYWSHQSPEKV